MKLYIGRVHDHRATSLVCNWRDNHHHITSQGTTMTPSHSIFITYVYRPFLWKEEIDSSPFSTELFI